MKSVLVLGAGVSGLTSALLLLERGLRVRIQARELPHESTSAVAAALWYPFEAAPADKVGSWALRSLARFRALAGDPATGVLEHEVLDLRSPAQEAPAWLATLGYEDVPGSELPPGFEQGWRLRAPVIEMPRYLPWLLARVQALGGTLERRTLSSLAGLPACDALVNCTGIGALELCGDRECFPIRGQIVRVPRGDVARALVFQRADGSFGYVVPRSQDCVLGGTKDRGDSSLEPRPDSTRLILERCRELEPRLRPEIRSVAVGLRPGRSAIRLTRERLPDGRALVHDYGHGGCGVTLSWACAEDVLALVEEALA
jgi:D-amino-acid oxidase